MSNMRTSEGKNAMSNKIHPLHVVIGNIFEEAIPESYELIRDEASGGRQSARAPLGTNPLGRTPLPPEYRVRVVKASVS